MDNRVLNSRESSIRSLDRTSASEESLASSDILNQKRRSRNSRLKASFTTPSSRVATTSSLKLRNDSSTSFEDEVLQKPGAGQLKHFAVEYENFRQRLRLSKKVDNQELEKALKCTDKDIVHAEIVRFSESLRHKTHVKDQSDRSKLSSFADSTLKFFDTYSGIAEIVKGLDNRAGPIAYGTFHIFLTVAQSKEMHRALMERIFEQLCKWLPRLKVIKDKDGDHSRLMKFVFDIYSEIVSFFQYATEYLCSTKASRAWKIVSRPPQHDLQARLDTLIEKSNNLLEEMLVRLYEINDEINAKLTRIEDATKKTTASAEQRARDEHHNQLRRVATALGLPLPFDTYITSMISHCDSEAYQARFQFQQKAAFGKVRLQQISLEALHQRPQYKAWMSTKQSSLLLLGGENTNLSINQSWLSPATTKFLHFVQQDPRCKAAFHSINATRAFDQHRRDPEYEILLALRSILYQILSQGAQLSQSSYDRLFPAGGLPKTDSLTEEQIEEQISNCVDMMLEVLSPDYLRGQTIYIILDGIEQLSASESAPQILIDSIERLLTEVDEGMTVKVLAIWSPLALSKAKSLNDQAWLRHALGLGANRDFMNMVFADLFWTQPVLNTGH